MRTRLALAPVVVVFNTPSSRAARLLAGLPANRQTTGKLLGVVVAPRVRRKRTAARNRATEFDVKVFFARLAPLKLAVATIRLAQDAAEIVVAARHRDVDVDMVLCVCSVE